MDMRMKTYPLEFDGKHFELSVNMNVLADLQEQADGDLRGLLERKRSLRLSTELLAACMNDYADAMGWESRYTPKQLGRAMPFRQQNKAGVALTKLLAQALLGDMAKQEPPAAEAQEETEKNSPTREDDETASTLPGT